jgi:tetratricopeptide (TPR) repeat protein
MSRSSNVSHSPLASRKLPVFSREQEGIRWFEENKSRLFKGAGVFFTVVACGLLIIAYQRHQDFLALEKLRLGIAELQAGRLEEAIPLLEKAKDLLGPEDDGTQVANFYLTEVYVRQGQLDQIKDLVVPRDSSTENDYLFQLLLLTQGRSAEKQNDQANARKLYEDAAALSDGPLGADALLGLARVTESTGDTAAANAAREKFLTSYPNSPFADIVRQKLDK